MIGKRLRDWTRDDVYALISEEILEDDGIEFKADLSSKDGRRADPWWNGGKVGDKARNEIVEEIIAFANGHGGTVFIGIGESNDKPARAASVESLPHCAELAERFKHFCRDCIEPRLALIEIAGVQTQDDGCGIVAIHTPKSMLGPHRHTANKECYVRRADRSERMTMREIQDLTLLLDKGIREIERRFEECRATADAHPRLINENNLFTVRATLVPMSPLYVDRAHGHEHAAFRPPMVGFQGRLEGAERPIVLGPAIGDLGDWRPILRGSQNIEDHSSFLSIREVYCDGLMEYRLACSSRDDDCAVPSDWLLKLFGNALCAAEKFRRAAGATGAEYGLEYEIKTSGADHSLVPPGHNRAHARMFPTVLLPSGSQVFPRYSVNSVEEFQSLALLFQQDLFDYVGAGGFPPLLLDFDTALASI